MARDPSIECPHYVALAGTRRCQSYLDGGGCTREDTFLCTEWVRKNSSQQAQKPVAVAPSGAQAPVTDLFGRVVRATPSGTRAESKPQRSPALPLSAQAQPSLTRPITEEQIKALEERGVELCVRSDAVSELWLVPAYTGAARKEMTFRDAATIAAVCSVFPGAEVTKFERDRTRSAPT